jgi:hypothetical protein
MFEIRVLRRMFGPKRDEVIRGWRKVHNEEIRVGRRGMNIGFWLETRRKRPLGRPRCR